MRCKACDAVITVSNKDPLTGEYSDLCGSCFSASEMVREGTYQDWPDYAHMGSTETIFGGRGLQSGD